MWYLHGISVGFNDCLMGFNGILSFSDETINHGGVLYQTRGGHKR
jgi:hypothetical protein